MTEHDFDPADDLDYEPDYETDYETDVPDYAELQRVIRDNIQQAVAAKLGGYWEQQAALDQARAAREETYEQPTAYEQQAYGAQALAQARPQLSQLVADAGVAFDAREAAADGRLVES